MPLFSPAAGSSLVVGERLLIASFVQLRIHKYVPAIYWVAAGLVSGTLITDNLVDRFGEAASYE